MPARQNMPFYCKLYTVNSLPICHSEVSRNLTGYYSLAGRCGHRSLRRAEDKAHRAEKCFFARCSLCWKEILPFVQNDRRGQGCHLGRTCCSTVYCQLTTLLLFRGIEESHRLLFFGGSMWASTPTEDREQNGRGWNPSPTPKPGCRAEDNAHCALHYALTCTLHAVLCAHYNTIRSASKLPAYHTCLFPAGSMRGSV